MPVSEIRNIFPIMHEVVRLQPKSICDLGVGFGKYGVLCREVLEAVHGRCSKESWEVYIVGYEGFHKYSNPVWGAYNMVFTRDFRKYYQQVKGFDLVLMIDSLEHLERTEAEVTLHTLVQNNSRVIVSVPTGICPQGAEFGNEFERHRSTWDGYKDFRQYDYKLLHVGVCTVVSIKGYFTNSALELAA